MAENKYFILSDSKSNKIRNMIQQRRQRKLVCNLNEAVYFSPGDIVVVVFWKAYVIYRFEGICMSVRKRNFLDPNAALVLRNIVLGVGVEFTVSYFMNRVYNLSVADYKRKDFVYKRSKLYYIRQRINRASRVK